MSLDARRLNQVGLGDVEAVLTGYLDNTYNPCTGWIFYFGSN